VGNKLHEDFIVSSSLAQGWGARITCTARILIFATPVAVKNMVARVGIEGAVTKRPPPFTSGRRCYNRTREQNEFAGRLRRPRGDPAMEHRSTRMKEVWDDYEDTGARRRL